MAKSGGGSRPHVVSRSAPRKKRVEARTTEINVDQLAKLIKHRAASDRPPSHDDAELEIVADDDSAAIRMATGRLAHTMRRGARGAPLPERPASVADGSGALPPTAVDYAAVDHAAAIPEPLDEAVADEASAPIPVEDDAAPITIQAEAASPGRRWRVLAVFLAILLITCTATAYYWRLIR